MRVIDAYGRYHDKEVTEAKPLPCNNAWIETLRARVMGFSINYEQVRMELLICMDIFGFDRHRYDDDPPISFDEVIGVFGLGIADINLFERFKRQHWQICNLPGFAPKPFYKWNWPMVIYQMSILAYNFILFNLSKGKKGKNPRKMTRDLPHTWPIAFKQPAKHVYFYYRCVGEKPGLYLTFKFVTSAVITIFRGDVNSCWLLGTKLLSLDKDFNMTRLEEWLMDLFDNNLDIGNIVTSYYPSGHPFRVRMIEYDKFIKLQSELDY